MVKKSEVPGQLWALSGSTTQAPPVLWPSTRRGKGSQASDQAGEDGRTRAKLSPPVAYEGDREALRAFGGEEQVPARGGSAGLGVHQHPAHRKAKRQPSEDQQNGCPGRPGVPESLPTWGSQR